MTHLPSGIQAWSSAHHKAATKRDVEDFCWLRQFFGHALLRAGCVGAVPAALTWQPLFFKIASICLFFLYHW